MAQKNLLYIITPTLTIFVLQQEPEVETTQKLQQLEQEIALERTHIASLKQEAQEAAAAAAGPVC